MPTHFAHAAHDGEAGCVGGHKKERDAGGAVAEGPGGDDHEVGAGAGGDVGLGAVESPVLGLVGGHWLAVGGQGGGVGAQGADIGSAVWFCNAEGGDGPTGQGGAHGGFEQEVGGGGVVCGLVAPDGVDHVRDRDAVSEEASDQTAGAARGDQCLGHHAHVDEVAA